MAIAAESLIQTPSGEVTADKALQSGDCLCVFTWDGRRITIGHVMAVRKRIALPTRITLDDGSRLLLTSRSKIFSRDGSQKEIEALKFEDSLLPMYTRFDADGYQIYYEPGDWCKGAETTKDGYRWRRVSRMVAEAKLGRRVLATDRVEFADKNRKNASPENLRILHRKRKMLTRKVDWVETVVEAKRLIDDLNHKIDHVDLDISQEMITIKGISVDNFACNGIFVSVDAE